MCWKWDILDVDNEWLGGYDFEMYISKRKPLEVVCECSLNISNILSSTSPKVTSSSLVSYLFDFLWCARVYSICYHISTFSKFVACVRWGKSMIYNKWWFHFYKYIYREMWLCVGCTNSKKPIIHWSSSYD